MLIIRKASPKKINIQQYDIDQIFGKIFERTIAKEMCKNKMTGLIDRSHVMKTQTIVKNFYQKVRYLLNLI